MEVTFDRYEYTLEKIKAKEFPENRDSKCFMFGKLCVYHSICHHGEMPTDLVDLNKEKK